MSKSIAYGIRCLDVGPNEMALANRLITEVPNANVWLIVDSLNKPSIRKRNFASGHISVVPLTTTFLDSCELFRDHPRVGWLCGDYALYALAAEVDADFYWIIEPDVCFTHRHLSDLFIEINSRNDDITCLRFGEAAPRWHWASIISAYGFTAHCCNFPFIRFSRSAVRVLREGRQRMSHTKSTKPSLAWPNDESFTASLAASSSLSISRLEDIFPDSFHFFSTDIPILNSQISSIPENQVVHPCLDEIGYRRKVRSVVYGSLAGSRLRKTLDWLNNQGLNSGPFINEANTQLSAWIREHNQNAEDATGKGNA